MLTEGGDVISFFLTREQVLAAHDINNFYKGVFMKNTNLKITVIIILLAIGCAFTVSAVQAQEVISVSPGKTEVREFYLYDVFDFGCLCPVQGYIINTIGPTTPAGELSVGLTCKPTRTFTSQVRYSVLGVGLAIDFASFDPAQIVKFFYATGADPGAPVAQKVAINANLGIVALIIKIDKIVGEVPEDVQLPIPFTITLGVTEGTPPEEPAE